MFSNGIILLAAVSMLILVAFRGRTDSLIPLYAVGVFLAFTLSQAGMVRHWWRHRDAHWRRSMIVNALGALASGAVLLTAAVTKFVNGAWVVVVAIPLMTVILLRVKAHYASVEQETSVANIHAMADANLVPSRTGPAAGSPSRGRLVGGPVALQRSDVRDLLVVPVARIDVPSLRALSYAVSLGQPTLALHVSPEQVEADRFQDAWERWGAHVPLEVVVSPYRAVIGPIVNYVEALHAQRPDLILTVVVPEIKVRRFWHSTLHDHLGDRLRRALEHHSGIIVTEVPFHLTQ